MRRNLKSHLLAISFLVSSPLYAETIEKFVKSEQQIREEMVILSRELGVTCTECHNVQNFADDSKNAFKIGKEHIRITQVLKQSGFDGKKGPTATCYMCHRGKLNPDFKEKLPKSDH